MFRHTSMTSKKTWRWPSATAGDHKIRSLLCWSPQTFSYATFLHTSAYKMVRDVTWRYLPGQLPVDAESCTPPSRRKAPLLRTTRNVYSITDLLLNRRASAIPLAHLLLAKFSHSYSQNIVDKNHKASTLVLLHSFSRLRFLRLPQMLLSNNTLEAARLVKQAFAT